jgi:hypothetical protein
VLFEETWQRKEETWQRKTQQNALWPYSPAPGCRSARQPGLTAEKKRVAASGERNEHRRVASPRPGWRRRARPGGPQLTGWTTTGLLSQTLPSRGESISFLSPAPAAGLLFSPMRQKERSPKNTARKAPAPWPFPALFGPPPRRKFGRRPPRRFAPGRIGRAMRSIATSSAQSSKAPAGRRQRKELRAPSSSSHRPRWRRLAHSAGVQFSCLPTAAAKVQPLSAQCRLVEAGGPDASPRGGRNFVAAPPATGPSPKKNLAPRSLSARQRNPVQTRALRLNDFATLGAARAPTGCSTGPPVATCMVRALAEIDQTTFGCLIDFLLQQSRAGAARHSKAGVGSATSYDCPPRAAAQLRLR